MVLFEDLAQFDFVLLYDLSSDLLMGCLTLGAHVLVEQLELRGAIEMPLAFTEASSSGLRRAYTVREARRERLSIFLHVHVMVIRAVAAESVRALAFLAHLRTPRHDFFFGVPNRMCCRVTLSLITQCVLILVKE